jgi:hypothetical protein
MSFLEAIRAKNDNAKKNVETEAPKIEAQKNTIAPTISDNKLISIRINGLVLTETELGPMTIPLTPQQNQHIIEKYNEYNNAISKYLKLAKRGVPLDNIKNQMNNDVLYDILVQSTSYASNKPVESEEDKKARMLIAEKQKQNQQNVRTGNLSKEQQTLQKNLTAERLVIFEQRQKEKAQKEADAEKEKTLASEISPLQAMLPPVSSFNLRNSGSKQFVLNQAKNKYKDQYDLLSEDGKQKLDKYISETYKIAGGRRRLTKKRRNRRQKTSKNL